MSQRKRLARLLPCLQFAIVLAACSTPATPAPTPTSIPTATAEPTLEPTPVWFPPTATSTAFPTPGVTPTVELALEVGPVIFEDNFDDPSIWESPIRPEGNVGMAKNEMAIVINEPGGFQYSLRRQPNLTDFYLEVTASPALCMGLDEYGVIVRAETEGDNYRYSLSCDGQVRLDRIYRGGAAALVPWEYGAGVPPGAPSSVRLGVWVHGEEMRFYANDQLQFTIHDPLLPNGRIGLFARSANESAVTIGFSELVVYQIDGSE